MRHPRPSTAADLRHLSALLQRVGGGDAEAFAELHALTRRKLQRTASAACRGSCDPDDVLQDSYLKIWRAASSFDCSRASPITWMCTIVRNTALDSARARKLAVADLSDAMDVPAPGEEIEEFDYEFARQITAEALRNLPEDRRRLISLAYVEGMSRLSLAEQFGVPVGTIKTWLRRAIASVREECLASGRAPLLQTAAG